MATHDILETYDELEEYEHIPYIRNLPRQEQRPPKTARSRRKRPKREPEQIASQLIEQIDGQQAFDFTYKASRHEREWINNSLGGFYEGQWLDDVLRLLKGGKEANVYQCLANPSVAELEGDYIAAKVYRPRQFRNLKNDHVYRQGRAPLDDSGNAIIDDGMLHAMSQRSGYGLKLLHTSWIEHEYQAMKILHAAGGDVPTPLERGNNAILMEYIGDHELPAPTLNSVRLDPDEALPLFKRVVRNIDLLLANDRVHGDLSAFNILYWQGRITLIDFPQVVDPNVNRDAYAIFERDVRRVCEYFASQGVLSRPRRLTADLWTAYGHRLGPDVHPALLDADDEADRAYWQRLNEAS